MTHEFYESDTVTTTNSRRRDDRSTLVGRPGRGDSLLTIGVVGNGADGETYSEKLGPYLDEFGPSYFIKYPAQAFSIDSVGDRFLEAAEKSDGMPTAIISFSMGQMVMNHLFSKPGFADDAGTIDCWLSDSGVTNITNLRLGTLALLHLGSRTRVTPFITELYDKVMDVSGNKDKKRFHRDSPQWRWMRAAKKLEPGSLNHIKIPVKKMLSAKRDHKVKHVQSYEDQNAIWGGGWDLDILSERRWNGHTEGLYRPQDFTAILKKLKTDKTL